MNRSHTVLIGCGAQAKYALDIFSLLNVTVDSVLDPIGHKTNSYLGEHLIEDAETFLDLLPDNESGQTLSVLVCLSDNLLKSEYYARMASKATFTTQPNGTQMFLIHHEQLV